MNIQIPEELLNLLSEMAVYAVLGLLTSLGAYMRMKHQRKVRDKKSTAELEKPKASKMVTQEQTAVVTQDFDDSHVAVEELAKSNTNMSTAMLDMLEQNKDLLATIKQLVKGTGQNVDVTKAIENMTVKVNRIETVVGEIRCMLDDLRTNFKRKTGTFETTGGDDAT